MSGYAQRGRIVLASASPRRRELLESLGIDFAVIPADVDEDIGAKGPVALVKALSKKKAEAVATGNECVIGSDTVVYARGKVIGKPYTVENAIKTIGMLNGRWHTVYTGVTVLYKGEASTFAEKSRVKFKRMSDEQISAYVNEKLPLDKAGAYGIQDGEVVEKYAGSYSNIVGLPLEKLTKTLKRIGVIYGND